MYVIFYLLGGFFFYYFMWKLFIQVIKSCSFFMVEDDVFSEFGGYCFGLEQFYRDCF